ncbi:MAG: hypothetical protein HY329_27375 [Chloroflexi bacterium]|nr:hypothetical protein [Chloroflexota bacterium]
MPATWRKPWRYATVLDFGPGQTAQLRCARCGRAIGRFLVTLTDSLRARHNLGLGCAAVEIDWPEPTPASAAPVASRLRKLAGKGVIPMGELS